jgi:hypothetical protein
MPCPHSLCGAGPSEVAPSVRLPVRRVHLALRRCSQRPSIDRMALDFRQSSFRHVTRVSPSPGFSVFSPLSALPAGSCPLALSSLGKPLTQGSPLNPSHLRWGCCMSYCGAPDAGGRRLQAVVRQGSWERSLLCPPVATPCHTLYNTIPLSDTRLADDLIRLEEQCRRYGQTYGLGGLQVDDQGELRGLLHG